MKIKGKFEQEILLACQEYFYIRVTRSHFQEKAHNRQYQ